MSVKSFKARLWFHIDATQGLRSREPVLVLHRVLVSGPITALAPRKKGYNFGEAHVMALRWTQGGSARTYGVCKRPRVAGTWNHNPPIEWG